MKQLVNLVVGLILIATIGCKSTNKLTTVISKKDSSHILVDPHADSVRFINKTLEGLEKNKIDFKTFSAKMKVDYWDKDGKGPDLTVFVRMQKDSLIWLSINATVFSYEAFRVLITPDSVKLLNKKDKIAQFRSVHYLREVAQLPLDFQTLQDMILGNPIFLDSNIVSYNKQAEAVSLLSVGSLFKNLLTLSNDSHLLRHSKLDDITTGRNRTCDLSYSGYDQTFGFPFSAFRQIGVSEKSKLDVQLEFKQYSFNESLNFPFTIPKNYSVQ